MAKELWEKIYQCQRLADANDDTLTIDRLQDYISQLKAEAFEAEDREARLRLQYRYHNLVRQMIN